MYVKIARKIEVIKCGVSYLDPFEKGWKWGRFTYCCIIYTFQMIHKMKFKLFDIELFLALFEFSSYVK